MAITSTGLTLSFLPTCLGGYPDPQWRLISIKVRDEAGQFMRDPRHPENERIIQAVQNIATGELYNYEDHNEAADVAMKCFCICVFSPVYALYVIAADLLLALLHTVLVIKEAFAEHTFVDFCKCLGEGFVSQVLDDLKMAALSPLFWVGVELGAIVGLLSPNDGREIVAKVERAWHRGATREDDLRHRTHVKEVPSLLHHTWFLAYCFQPRGNLHEMIDVDGQLKPKNVIVGA